MSYTKGNLKAMFQEQLQERAVDKDGKPMLRKLPNGEYMNWTRGDQVIDKCISRAERGDMYAVKLIVDLLQPKELRVAVASAITIENKLSPALQSIVDRLLVVDNETDNDIKIIKDEGGAKIRTPIPKTTSASSISQDS